MNRPVLQALDDVNFYSVMQSTQGPSLVFFSSVGCSSCRYWKALLEQLASEKPEIKLFEIDAQQSMGLTREYEVFHLPALFVFSDGEYYAPLQCEASLNKIKHSLDTILAAPAEDAP